MNKISTSVFYGLLLFLMHCLPVSAAGHCTSAVDTHIVELGTAFVPTQSTPGTVVSMTQKDIQVTCASSVATYLQPGDSGAVWGSTGETFTTPEGKTCPILDKGFALEGVGLGLVWVQRNSGTGEWSCLSSALMGGGKVRRGLVRNGVTTLTERFYVVRTSLPLVYGNTGAITQSIDIDEANEARQPIGRLYSIQIAGDVIIENGGCTIDASPVISMGTVATKSFRGIGSTSSDVPFNISLRECYGTGKQVDISFHPVSGFADAARSVIALDEGSSTASGVGIQLLFNGEHIHPDGQSHYYPLQQGVTWLPFIARYYQTGTTVRPGTVESSVIFYIYYQ
ncbi:fimbrial protein [Erwinia papayae]|uniref:Fimbrial protein n=2 Tax=Erwinia TaxID=551 RepID=A0A014M8T5_9GAMM|nr:fimbrial protein [Erwinia mallotivora]EXU74504.1 fimbrial protein [Erwinia mallotivora]